MTHRRDAGTQAADNVHRSVVIENQRGLHARAAAKFVKLVGGFDADVSVRKDGQIVSGSSIMGLMMLAAGAGSEIELVASGRQAKEAVDGLVRLVANRFDED
jgi:phosphocarrier protein